MKGLSRGTFVLAHVLVFSFMGSLGCGSDIGDPGVDVGLNDVPTDPGTGNDPGSSGDTDTTVDSDASVDVDAAPDVQTSLGNPCETNSECLSGFCVPSSEGKVCTTFCIDDCADGWTCRSFELPGQDITFLCLDRNTNLCRPCTTHNECRVLGGTDADRCVDFQGTEGSFCAVNCAGDLGCPDGYTCEDTLDSDSGQSFTLCLPDSGECSCNAAAIADAAQTDCYDGGCQGVRACTETGLSACSAEISSEEICDDQDNNCNGEVDEELGTTTCGLGPCETTIENCANGIEQSCEPLDEATAESCDGIDNDCDGNVDNGLTSPLADDQAGVCSGQLKVCNGADGWGEPGYDGVVAGYEATEFSCDGLDNDCDGNVDNGLAAPLADDQTGVCSGQLKICDGADGWGEPDNDLDGDGYGRCGEDCDDDNPLIHPNAPEVCDNINQDCNELVDEGLGTTTCGVGNCEVTVENCLAGVEIVCEPGVPAAEICDGLDNDCDGSVDEELGSTTCGLGPCETTVENCVGGVDQSCEALDVVSAESCDGIDNDCDGSVDNDLGGTSCGEGVCAHTVANCEAGEPQFCNPFDGAGSEICDGLDNDCEGTVDNGLTAPPAPKQHGVCAGQVQFCEGSEGWQEPDYDVVAGYEATEISCDGLDNDCDGNVDNGLTAPLTDNQNGVCSGLVKVCVGVAGWQDPNLNTVASYEALETICDGLDNDCDGTVDEDQGSTTCGLGPCETTIENCVGGVDQTCEPLAVDVPEICDLVDNDCDGSVDEDLGATTCGMGPCVTTVENCVAGIDQICEPLDLDVPESCDLVDNDCDGVVDEDLGSTTCGLGPCETTIENCVAGVDQTCEPLDVDVPESCDLVDNDCDGAVDEELGSTTCGLGACETTVENCVGGVDQTCEALDVASTDICDGIDNDCDGLVDEDLGTTSCGAGVCASTIENCVGGVDQSCAPLNVTGGTITNAGARTIHTFTTPGSFTLSVNAGCAVAEILVVGGGGKGGVSGGGGGGAGGHVLHQTSVALNEGDYSGVVGEGAILNPQGYSGGTTGGDGIASSFDSFVAAPGTNGSGYGGDSGNILNGVVTNYTGGQVLASPSNGGGAGAGSNGHDGSSSPGGSSGSGGNGLQFSISGTSTYYGGGGGAGYHCGAHGCPGGGSGGLGGGGSGGNGGSCSGCFPKVGSSGSPGQPNTGGGGGGGGGVSGCCHGYGASGGSGIVIISYTP